LPIISVPSSTSSAIKTSPDVQPYLDSTTLSMEKNCTNCHCML
jgi:hypothetical protein